MATQRIKQNINLLNLARFTVQFLPTVMVSKPIKKTQQSILTCTCAALCTLQTPHGHHNPFTTLPVDELPMNLLKIDHWLAGFPPSSPSYPVCHSLAPVNSKRVEMCPQPLGQASGEENKPCAGKADPGCCIVLGSASHTIELGPLQVNG